MDKLKEMLLDELKRAENNFNNATEDSIDAATYELNAIHEKINQYFKERRKVNERNS